MEIRLADTADYKRIAMSLYNKRINYNTPAQAKEDIAHHRLYIVEHEGKILAQCALVYEPLFQYYAIKRLVIYNQKNCGLGIAQSLIDYITSFNLPVIGCTPWSDNVAMIKLLEKNGFKYQYTFLENYNFFKKVIDK